MKKKEMEAILVNAIIRARVNRDAFEENGSKGRLEAARQSGKMEAFEDVLNALRGDEINLKLNQ